MTGIVVVDLGMGNLRSVARALERAGGAPSITSEPRAIAAADRLVVPGQGHFRDCALAIDGAIGDALRAFLSTERPYLGICLGMQALLEESEEAPGARGLGIVAGRVARFPRDMRDASGARLKVPHMGWNEIDARHPMLAADPWFYFVHSYRCEPRDEAVVAARADHGGTFCAAIAKENLLAVQFHPEKSGAAGHALLVRFVEDRWS